MTLHVPTISELHKIAQIPPPEHPLVSVVKVEELPEIPGGYPSPISYGFYAMGFKKNLKGYVDYGRKTYDFQEGVLTFTAPEQVMSFANTNMSETTGWYLLFHEDLLKGHRLANQMDKYRFFGYDVSEALHMSHKEEAAIDNIFANIYHEYLLPIDKFSKNVILSNLELLLTYSERYYERQFLTRSEVSTSIATRFDKELKHYFNDSKHSALDLPSVGYFADRLHVSANYLGDMLRVLTGKSTQEHIHDEIIQLAKYILLNSDKSISQIAFELGFEYPQYFSRLFKKKAGLSPKQYRATQNLN